jgi:hypothetical protein
MTISLSCDSCGRNYKLKDEAAGKKIRCKDCETILHVPELDNDLEDYGDDSWSDSGGGAGQDDFWNSSDDEWSNTGADSSFDAPSAYPVKSGTSTGTRKKKSSKKKKKSGGGSGGALAAKIGGGVFIGLVLIAALMRVGGAVGKLDLGGGLSWKEFQAPGTPFKLQMPGTPKQGSQFQAGISITQFMLEVRRPERAFGIMHATIPIPDHAIGNVGADDIANVFRESKQGLILGAPGARVHSESNLNIADAGGNSHPGVELTVTIQHKGQPLKFAYRMFLIGNRMVILLAGTDEKNFTKYKSDFDKFLKSLEVTQAVTPLSGPGGGGNSIFPGGQPGQATIPGSPFQSGGEAQEHDPIGDMNRRMQEDHQRFIEENRQRMEENRRRMEEQRKASEERMREIRERSRRPPGFP